MARIFVSFHHDKNDGHSQVTRKLIKSIGHQDITLNEGTKIENEDLKSDESIRKEIRDKFLKDVDVTIVIVGEDTINRKHIDWEIRSTVHQFSGHRNGGIVVVNTLNNGATWLLNKKLIESHDGAPAPAQRSWPTNSEHTLQKYNWLPERLARSLVDNYDQSNSINGQYNHAVFPIISYSKMKNNPNILQEAIQQAIDFKKHNQGKWNMDKMRRKNNESIDRKRFPQVQP